MTLVYTNIDSIKREFDPLYKKIFYEESLLEIFNGQLDLTAVDYTNERLMLNLGHYFSLKDDIRQATFYYDKVTKLNSPLGLYSLAIFFYTKKRYPKAKLYATNGNTLNKDSIKKYPECAILLAKINIAENKFDTAEQLFLDEIEKNSDNIVILDELSLFYLNVLKNKESFLTYCTRSLELGSANAIAMMCQYNANIIDFDNLDELTKYATILINRDDPVGNYYMGVLNLKKVFKTCLNQNVNKNKIKGLIGIAMAYFESIKDNDVLAIHAGKFIGILHSFDEKNVNTNN